jgi:predicted O-methyltransferase YrrM
MYHFVRQVLMKSTQMGTAQRYKKALCNLAPKAIQQSKFGTKPSDSIIATKQLLDKISITPKYGKLLSKLVQSYEPRSILELGSGLGVSTYYLSQGSEKSSITSVEGMAEFADLASKTFRTLATSNVKITNSTFDDFIELLDPQERFDLIFIDGSHSLAATLKYFSAVLNFASPKAFIVLDDIRWSAEMLSAWHTVKKHQQVRVSVDLGRIGILFLDPVLQKQEYIIRY